MRLGALLTAGPPLPSLPAMRRSGSGRTHLSAGATPAKGGTDLGRFFGGRKAGRATSEKGLQSGALGLFASIVIGVSSVAPAYSLAATVGLIAAIVGLHSPFIFIVGFIPMILVASGFFYMNRADPDCGETFIWTSRAFGAPVGWVIGFLAVASSVIVMANLVQIAALYMWSTLGLDSLANSVFWTTVGGVGWLIVVGIFVAVGITVSAKAEYVLMAMQMIPLVLFTVWAFIKGYV